LIFREKLKVQIFSDFQNWAKFQGVTGMELGALEREGSRDNLPS
jgi:hypothetical protein